MKYLSYVPCVAAIELASRDVASVCSCNACNESLPDDCSMMMTLMRSLTTSHRQSRDALIAVVLSTTPLYVRPENKTILSLKLTSKTKRQ